MVMLDVAVNTHLPLLGGTRLRGIIILFVVTIMFFIMNWIGYLFDIPIVIFIIDLLWDLIGFILERPIAIVLTIALAIWFCVSTRAQKSAKSDLEEKRKQVNRSIPAGMGALIDHPYATSIIGYYKEGVVFTKNKMPTGTYKQGHGDFVQIYFNDMDYTDEDHDVLIGWCSKKTTSGWMIFVYEGVGTARSAELIAECYDDEEEEWIHPRDDDYYKSVGLANNGDAVGACAAYAILRHACREWNDDKLLKHFLKD